MLSRSASVTMLAMRTLDPDDARPPYAQLVDALRREIEEGALPPGSKLPTHQQLASQYGVSVGTVKRALGELHGADLIVSRQGQGAFVRTRRSLLASVPHQLLRRMRHALANRHVIGHWKNLSEPRSSRYALASSPPASPPRARSTNISPTWPPGNWISRHRP